MKYVQAERKDQGCIFCLAAHAGDDEPRHVLHRGEHCLVMLNAFPYNSGHLMVSPHRHLASIEDLDPGELLELMTLAQRALRDPPTTPMASTSASTKARSAAPASPATSTCTSSPAGPPTQLHGRHGRHTRAAPITPGHVRDPAITARLTPLDAPAAALTSAGSNARTGRTDPFRLIGSSAPGGRPARAAATQAVSRGADWSAASHDRDRMRGFRLGPRE